jgi:hypothetical protein
MIRNIEHQNILFNKKNQPEPPIQADLFHFDGSDYNKDLDLDRLTTQYYRIFDLMKDGKWRTLSEIAIETGFPTPSISAQLRHMRKPRFGAHIVRKQRVKGREAQGLFEYQLSVKGKEGC